jgi:hypothetical protein
MRIPSNIIQKNLYTLGGEFINKITYKDYQGYYYSVGGRFYIGKDFNPNATELLKKDSPEINPLLINPATFVYGKLSRINLQQNKPKSISFDPTDESFQQGYQIRYFAKKLNVIPIFIKEINKTDFYKLSQDPLYQTLEVKYNFDITDNELNALNQQMPGLGAYLQNYDLPTSSDENL